MSVAVRVPVRKAKRDSFDALTDRRFREMTKTVETLLRALPAAVPIADVTAALRSRTPRSAARGVKTGVIETAVAKLVPSITAVAESAARAEIRRTPEAKAVRATFDFALVNPAVVADAQKRAADLVVEITSSVRDSIRGLVQGAVAGETGGAPMPVARTIRSMVGLHSNWSRAVLNYQMRLESTGVSASNVSKLVSRYYSKLLSARAKNIARTEIMRAANAGKIASWRSMSEQGWLGTGRAQKMWEAAADAEEICAAADGQTVDLDDVFSTSEGSFDMPPAHPSCRCTATLIAGSAVA